MLLASVQVGVYQEYSSVEDGHGLQPREAVTRCHHYRQVLCERLCLRVTDRVAKSAMRRRHQVAQRAGQAAWAHCLTVLQLFELHSLDARCM